MILFYYFLAVILCFIVGFSGCKLLNIYDSYFLKCIRSNISIYILYGLILCICVLETIGLIIPISVLSYLLVLAVLLGSIFFRRDIKLLLLSLSKKDLVCNLALLAIPACIIGLPQLINSELYTIVGDNADIAYYLSSIEWLSSHSILSTIQYSEHFPFYSLAEYMIKQTRIGYDIYGAFLSNVYGLDPHEIFPILATISATCTAIAVYSCILYFTQKRYFSLLLGVYAGICSNTIALVAGEYVVQLCGMGLLLIAMTTIHPLLNRGGCRNSILCGLSVAGVLSVYCEYAIHIFIVSVICFIYYYLKKTVQLKYIFLTIILAIFFNVYGFIKAVVFNISIFFSVSEGGASAIDPYSGRIMGILNLFYTLFGGTSKEYLAGIQLPNILVVVFIVVTVTILYFSFISKKDNERSVFVCTSIFVIAILEIYFMMTGGAYQEYKHITSMSCLFICLIGFGLESFIEKYDIHYIIKVVFSGLLVICILFSISRPLKNYIGLSSTIDSKSMELINATSAICGDQGVGVDSQSFSIDQYMSTVYALRNHEVFLDNESSSYLQYFQKFNDHIQSKYIVYARNTELQVDLSQKDIVWCNDKYVLVEDNTVEEYNRMSLKAVRYGWGYGEFVDVYREADCIVAQAGSARHVLYGPYTTLPEGTYDFILEYDANTLNGTLGVFDVYCNGEILAQVELKGDSCQSVVLQNVEIEDTHDQIEFRVFVNEGVELKVEGILWKESTT